VRFTIGPELGRLLAAGLVRPREILAAGAKAAEAAIRRHFRGLPSRSGFFKAQVAGGRVQVSELTEEQAVVTVDSRELAHYIGGGRIEPVHGRALAIPVSDRARAAGYPSAGRIPGLFMRKEAGRATLCTTEGKVLETHYVLAGAVEQDPHPEAWPEEAIGEAARGAMQRAYDAQIRPR